MAYPITWLGSSLVSMAGSVDSDPIAIPPGTIGFSAIVTALGGTPSGISGNLQVCVSETGALGSYVPLSGSTMAVGLSNGNSLAYPFSFENAFYNFVLLRWNQAGPNDSGTLFDGAWSISLAPPSPPAPPAPGPAPAFTQAQLGTGRVPLSASLLTGYFNALFPFRWVAPGQSPIYSAIVSSIVQLMGFIGDQVLELGATLAVPVLPIGTTVTVPVSALDLQLRLRTADAPILDIAIHDFFGDTLPRLPNEANADYLNRALALLFQAKNTRSSIFNMLTSLTGQPPHIINPNLPSDVGGLTATVSNAGSMVGGKLVFTAGLKGPPSYLGIDQGGAPFRYANPNGRGTRVVNGVNGIYAVQPTGNNFGYAWQGFIDTTYPLNFGAQGDPVSGYATVAGSNPPIYDAAHITGTLGTPSVYTNLAGAGNGFCACSNPQVVTGPDGYAQNVYATVNAGLTGSEGMAELGPSIAWFNPQGLTAANLANGQATVLDAINKLRSEGITIWARCLPAQFLAAEGFTT